MNVNSTRILAMSLFGLLLVAGADAQDASRLTTASTSARLDFDKDGVADILWRDNATGDNTIWFMDGTRVKGTASLPNVPLPSAIVAVADYDGDADADILWSPGEDGSMTLWLLDGTFVQQLTLRSGLGRSVVATGDFNADGHTDIAWGAQGSTEVTLIVGGKIISSTMLPFEVIRGAGDFDGDGDDDLYGGYAPYYYIYFLNGGTVEKKEQISLPPTTAQYGRTGTGDFNGDGYADILWHNTGSGEVAISFFRDAPVEHVLLQPVSTELQLIGIGDVSGDGRDDIAWQHFVTRDVTVWLMDGANITGGGFLPRVKPSLALMSPPPGGNSGEIVVAESVCSYSIWNRAAYVNGGDVWVAYRADNGEITATEGKDAWYNAGPSGEVTLRAWVGDAKGNQTSPYVRIPIVEATSVSPLAVNMPSTAGEGSISVDASCTWNAYSGSSFIKVTSGANGVGKGVVSYSVEPNTTNAARTGTILVAGYSITIAQERGAVHHQPNRDFNRDGRADFFWTNPATGEDSLWLMNGSSMPELVTLPVAPPGFTAAGAGDFDGDGDSDVFWRNVNTGDNKIWLLHGSLIEGETELPRVTKNFRPAGIGDFDADGTADVVWTDQNWGATQSLLWLMQGGAVSSSALIPNHRPIIAVADFNNDGRDDLLRPDAILLVNGTTVVGSVPFPTVTDGLSISAAGDFDLDGDFDILRHDQRNGNVAVWIMDRTSVSSNVLLPAVSDEFNAVAVADIDGDQKAEIVWRNASTGENFFWTMNGAQIMASGPLPSQPVTHALVSPTPGSTSGFISAPASVCAGSIWNAVSVTNGELGTSYYWSGDASGYSAEGHFEGPPSSVSVIEATLTNVRGATSRLRKFVPIVAAGSVSSSSALFTAAGGSGSFSLTSGCSWFAASDQPFVTIRAGTSGTRNGQIAYDVAPNSGTERVATINVGGQSFEVRQSGKTSTRPDHDFNYDRRADFVWRNDTTGENAVWYLYPSENYGYTIVPNKGSLLPTASPDLRVGGVADFDGDGDADILWRNPATGANRVWLLTSSSEWNPPRGWWTNTQPQWTTSVEREVILPEAATAFRVAGVGDLDGDGRSDIVWRNDTTGENAVWMLRGDLAISGEYLPTIPPPMDIVAVDDFNNDFRADIFFRDASGTNAVWLMDGSTVSKGLLLPAVSNGLQVAGAGDLNGDGHADVVWHDPATGKVAVWIMQSGVPLSGKFMPTVVMNQKLAGVGDVDGNQKQDIIWRDGTTGENVVWVMDGGNISRTAPAQDAEPAFELVSPR